MYGGFDLNSFCDNLDDDYGIFDDVADSLNFASVGISTDKPAADLNGDCPHNSYAWQEKKAEGNKNNNSKTKGIVKQSLVGTKKRGRQPGQRGRCGACGSQDHNKRTCTFFPKSG